VKGLGGAKPLPLFEAQGEGLPYIATDLPLMELAEEVFEDYVGMRLTLRDHPVRLSKDGIGRTVKSTDLRDTPDGSWIDVCRLVITRQRPGTASGVVFITLEDETTTSNIVVWPNMFTKARKAVMTGRLLRVRGKLQREGIVTHVIANRIDDLSYLLDTLGDTESAGGNIDPTHSSADEAKRPIPLSEKPMTDKTPRDAVSQRPKRQDISAYYGAGSRHPREQVKKLFYSRDFH